MVQSFPLLWIWVASQWEGTLIFAVWVEPLPSAGHHTQTSTASPVWPCLCWRGGASSSAYAKACGKGRDPGQQRSMVWQVQKRVLRMWHWADISGWVGINWKRREEGTACAKTQRWRLHRSLEGWKWGQESRAQRVKVQEQMETESQGWETMATHRGQHAAAWAPRLSLTCHLAAATTDEFLTTSMSSFFTRNWRPRQNLPYNILQNSQCSIECT